MIRTAIVGFGNVGKKALKCIEAAGDFTLCGVVSTSAAPKEYKDIWFSNIEQLKGKADVAIVTLPTRMCPDVCAKLLELGICTVDSYDIHSGIVDYRKKLDAAAKKAGKAAVISAGWDPGSDSVVRALLLAMCPKGVTYINFGPGMSMGHTVAAKAVKGVKAALSITNPAGKGVHTRQVYIELEDGYEYDDVASRIKSDSYFSHDMTTVTVVKDVMSLTNAEHGVLIEREGGIAPDDKQAFGYKMRINNPALTAQVMISCARAAVRQAPGCYTMIELPPIALLEGERDELIAKLV